MKNLSDKLKLYNPQPAAVKTAQEPVLEFLPGWKRISTYVFLQETILPNPLKSMESLPQKFFTADRPNEKLVFFDTETTGLSVGAGSIIFLIGFANVHDNQFCIRQYFLSDFPGEPELIGCIEKELKTGSLYISYNGRAFDTHLIAARFTMHRKKLHMPDQLDLLYPVRIFWKSLIQYCNLSNVEQRLLNIRREKDIPGEQIPSVYFNYLKNKNTRLMELVIEHHKQDILSLAVLLAHMEKIAACPQDDDFVDHSRLSKFIASKDFCKAQQILQSRFVLGDQECGRLLAQHYKKAGFWKEAVSVWNKINEKACSFFSCIELSKYYEHKEKNYSLALFHLEQCMRLPLSLLQRSELALRKKRILEKQKK